jgi:hypothetical protein
MGIEAVAWFKIPRGTDGRIRDWRNTPDRSKTGAITVRTKDSVLVLIFSPSTSPGEMVCILPFHPD